MLGLVYLSREQTQPDSTGGLGTAADFLLLQGRRTWLAQPDPLSSQQTFMVVFIFFLISNLLLAERAARCFVACSAQGDVEEDLQILLDSTFIG